MKELLLRVSLGHPRLVVAACALITIVFATQFPRIAVDTDPENMLPADEAVRIHHDEIKEVFGLHDLLVVGFVRMEGAFRPETLERVASLTEVLLDTDGVIAEDLLAPTEVDDVYTTEDGILRVDTLMEEAPEDEAGGDRILVRIRDNPVLRGKLASDDGRALAIFVPLESKDVADEVAAVIRATLEELGGDEEVHLAGIPLAEDTFGRAMFVQMAIGAPAAFVLTYLLMLFFFRKPLLVAAPMVLSTMAVIWAMGLLIGCGFTVHIMSSMIPVFLIPIAVLDSIHVLTEFHVRYPVSRDKRQAMRETIDELFVPMAYTSLTTTVGFAALMLTPIPPVQIFGAFVAFGIAVAWLLSMTFTVSCAVLIPDSKLEGFGHVGGSDPRATRALHFVKSFAVRRARPIVVLGVLGLIVSVGGLLRIVVNDNPVKWFRTGHPLRVADDVMNAHLAGTYIAYLTLDGAEPDAFKDPDLMKWVEGLQQRLEQDPNVGTTTSIADIVKKVRGELKGDPAEAYVPDSREEIAQYLFLYEISGGDPEDLFKLVTPETDRVNLWVQMYKGDNQAVGRVVAVAEEYARERPRSDLEMRWAGLPYINIVWQGKMVAGMGKALASSCVVVLLLMSLLFRSFRLGLLSMIPLGSTILLVYGLIGWFGKPYDMPIAVLSSLTLGLSIDFAIHFLQRTREAAQRLGSVEQALDDVFGAPAQAILRNVVVIALGFVPMFFANLVPYITVSIFFFAIMIISGFATLVGLPALLSLGAGGHLERKGKAAGASQAAAAGKAAVIFVCVVLGSTAGLVTLPAPADAQTEGEALDPVEIMKESHLRMYYPADDGRAIVRMTLTDKKGKTRVREFVMLRLDVEDGGEQKYFTYFHEPNDVRRTTFMVWKDPHDDDARWIYIPAIDLVKRIAANDKGSSFVGSDFSYEDVSGRPWTDDEHELLRTEEVDGVSAHVIKSVPKQKDEFAHRISWIAVDSMLPLREEYYDKKDKLVKTYEALKIEEIEGYATVTGRKMTTVKKNHSTTVQFSDVAFDVGLEDDLFTERHLKNPPGDLVAR